MKLKSAIVIGLYLFSTSIYAQAPERCPSASSLATTIINNVYEDPNQPGIFYASVRNITFDTSNTWTLSSHDLKANSKDEALAKINASLKEVKLTEGPTPLNTWCGMPGSSGETWYCSYAGTNGVLFNAVTNIN